MLARQCSDNDRVASDDSSKQSSRLHKAQSNRAKDRVRGGGWYVLGREETSKPRIKHAEHASERRWGGIIHQPPMAAMWRTG